MFNPRQFLAVFVLLLAFLVLLCVFGFLSSNTFNSGVSMNPFSGEKYSIGGFEDNNIKQIELIEVKDEFYYVFEVTLKDEKVSPAYFKKYIEDEGVFINKFLFDGKTLTINVIGNERSNFRETIPYHFLNEVIDEAKLAYEERVSSLKVIKKMGKNHLKIERVDGV